MGLNSQMGLISRMALIVGWDQMGLNSQMGLISRMGLISQMGSDGI